MLVFEKGDEVMGELTAFASSRRLTADHFTAIGALSDATLGYFDRARKEYRKIPIREQVEVLSLVGETCRPATFAARAIQRRGWPC